ncbi:PhoX family protein [Magnetococcus sp. PR-3]|uniref:PhoX family protein n=1 Tax=Magnetococcus sp. PR-3 TaxID=3120355 RepID=UPI002FCDEBFD
MPKNSSQPLSDIIEGRLSRRNALKGLMGGGAVVAMSSLPGVAWACDDDEEALPEIDPTSFNFRRLDDEIQHTHRVADGYEVQTLLRWGDPVLADAPPFDPENQTAEAQKKQFGYNNDFVTFMPLPVGSQNANHGLLCVNHEFTKSRMMFPEELRDSDLPEDVKRVADVEMAAHGHSVVEIRRQGVGKPWEVVTRSRYNQRLTALETKIRISGPAAGHVDLQTQEDPTGQLCIGTLNNCAGGVTPWGTVLLGEENINHYFGGDPQMTDHPSRYTIMGIQGRSSHRWSEVYARFDIEQTPNEPNRFGWVVEVDPYDPTARPVKRTALGRFKHEGATCTVLPDGRVALYSGDDTAGEFLYRFVTRDRWNATSRQANRDVLDHGTLSVAKFEEDGFISWIPLVHGQQGLEADQGFQSQADVLIQTRRAARVVGATPLDRPEDVQVNPYSGRLYVALSNNYKRQKSDAVNPRAPNIYGHILELTPPMAAGPDHGADRYIWNILLMGGPLDEKSGSAYNAYTEQFGNWLAGPDNFSFDRRGRMWIATDQGGAQIKRGHADGLFACDLQGMGRALPKRLFSCPMGAEMCGPAFTPDDRTLFLAVQHPGEASGVTYENPVTRWPDFKETMPARPSVVAVTHKKGGEIGG